MDMVDATAPPAAGQAQHSAEWGSTLRHAWAGWGPHDASSRLLDEAARGCLMLCEAARATVQLQVALSQRLGRHLV